ncbi:MAG TPA: cell envelope integrity protein TolA [Caulobacterales bacterium]|nr:cell envelope integrity protein TolA [Caulobacterales bacterium]
MRPGLVVSFIGHVGFVLMTLLVWRPTSMLIPTSGAVVPVEIVATAPESNVRALSNSNEEPTPAPEQQVAPPEPTPSPTPAPPPPRPQRQRDEFDLAAIAGLLDKQRQAPHERTQGAHSDRSQRGAGSGTADVVSMQDRVRALMEREMRRCWRAPMDLPDPERLVVTVQFDLDRNGHLRGQPRVTSPQNYTFDAPMRAAVESALRAVRACDPYPFPDDPVVGDHFEIWSQLEHTFRPGAQ